MEVSIAAKSKPSAEVKIREQKISTLRFQCRAYLRRLRFFSVMCFICHIVVTIILLFMGFQKGPHGEPYSSTIVLAAFGGLITVVWAGVGAWEAFIGSSHGDLPSWEWHSSHFMTGVGVLYFLMFFQWPSIIVYLIHALGGSFWSFINQAAHTDLRSIVIFHIISYILVFLTDAGAIILSTSTLRVLQGPNEQHRQVESSMVQRMAEARKQAPTRTRLFALLKFAFDLIFTIDLIVIASRRANSGTALMCVIQGVMYIGSLFLGFQLVRCGREFELESWLINWRVASIFHLFVSWVVFWVPMGITIMVEAYGTEFFAAVSRLPQHMGGYVIGELVMFVFYLIFYFGFLQHHARCMRFLDEIASLQLLDAQDTHPHRDTNIMEDDGGDDEDDVGDSGQRHKSTLPLDHAVALSTRGTNTQQPLKSSLKSGGKKDTITNQSSSYKPDGSDE